jgi:hypothetical protein
MNAELGRDPGVMGDARAGDHRLGRRASIVDAGAAELAFLDQGYPPARVGQIGRERHAALARTDHDRVVGLHGIPSAGRA